MTRDRIFVNNCVKLSQNQIRNKSYGPDTKVRQTDARMDNAVTMLPKILFGEHNKIK